MHQHKKFTGKALLGVILMMTAGTGTMIAAKLLLDTKTVGLDGKTEKFSKAMYQSIVMFFAMSFCYPWYQVAEMFSICFGKKKQSDLSVNSEGGAEGQNLTRAQTLKNYCLICAPALCDLIATTLMTSGLIYIRVSVMQMLRGSMVIFSACLTVLFRHRKLTGYQWLGVALCSLALVIVGVASIVSDSGDDDDEYGAWYYKLLGCGLVIVSQVVQAIQIVVEEYILADVHAPPLVVVGMEGFWGMMFSVFIFIPMFQFIPGNDNGRFENTHDSVYRLFNSGKLAAFTGMYWICILLLNYGGMLVTSELTAVHRTIFEALRTFFIWIVQIIIHYSIDDSYGEDWNGWSYMQLGGFLVLTASMLIYHTTVKLRCFFTYPEDSEPAPEAEEKSLSVGEEQPLLQ